MATKTTSKAPRFDFTRLGAGDGVRVERTCVGAADAPQRAALYATLRVGDALVNPLTIGQTPEDGTVDLYAVTRPSAAALGELDRLQQVMEAVARYLTTGGDWGAFSLALSQLRRLLPAGGLAFPGWSYHQGGPVVDHELGKVTYQHVFVAAGPAGDDTPAAVWVEDVFVDVTTLGRFNEGVERAEAIIRPAGPARPQLQLPPPADP